MNHYACRGLNDLRQKKGLRTTHSMMYGSPGIPLRPPGWTQQTSPGVKLIKFRKNPYCPGAGRRLEPNFFRLRLFIYFYTFLYMFMCVCIFLCVFLYIFGFFSYKIDRLMGGGRLRRPPLIKLSILYEKIQKYIEKHTKICIHT